MGKAQTLKEWHDEAAHRFGDNRENWAFVCPACGRVTTVREFMELELTASTAAQECIGRHNGHMRPPSDTAKADGLGCNWVAYGLLGCMGRGRTVTTEDGREVEVFDFAKGDHQNGTSTSR